MNTRFLWPRGVALGDTGTPLSGAKLYFYSSGTSTPKATYTDAGLTTPSANPVVADAAGRFADIYLGSGNYKVVLQTSAGVTVWTADPVASEVITTSAFMASLLDDTSASAALTTLGFSSYIQGLADDADAGAAQTTLGMADAQAWRNAIQNGDFRVHQRNTASATANGEHVVDRWRVIATGGSRTATRVALADSDRVAIGRHSARYCLQYAATGAAGASDVERFEQRMEDVRTLAGQTVTAHFWARRTAGSGDMAVELMQYFGTGGSPSASTTNGNTRLTLTTTWTRYSVTVALPGFTAATGFGTNEDSYLALNLFFSAGSSFNSRTGSLGAQTVTVQIADVVVEPGTAVSPFRPRPISVELDWCQRYLEMVEVNPLYRFLGGAVAFNGAITRIPFKVAKRTTPTLTLYSGSQRTGTSGLLSIGGGGTSNLFSTSSTALDVGIWDNGALAAAGNYATGSIEATAEL